jgi:hypothetical protein
MKPIYLLAIFFLSYSSVTLLAQNDIYFQSIVYTDVSLRGPVTVLGTVNADLPTDGYVVVHFDGLCYAAVGDRVVLAASNNGNWESNDGNVGIESSRSEFGRSFSHTRLYHVSAGNNTFYAVGQNAAKMEGSGIASIYGSLTVEYFPDTGPTRVTSGGFVFSGDVANSTVVSQQTIHANGPGKMVVRFDGTLQSQQSDRIILAASNTTEWSFDDGSIALEAVNKSNVDLNSFSHTRVYNVTSAGDYTYYALSQCWGKWVGDCSVFIYGNLLVEYFPDSGAEKILSDGFSLTEIDLNGGPTELTSLSLNAPAAGEVMVVLDGYLTANPGYDIVLAASNQLGYTSNDGNLVLQALDLDNNRYSFSHTRVYNIGAGTHTFYGVGEIQGGSGTETADLFGRLTVKYIPTGATAVTDLSAPENTIDIYPNPTSEVIHIAFKNPVDQEKPIQLLDSKGCVLKEYSIYTPEEIKIDISNFPQNLYWIKVGEILKPLIKM